MRNYREIVTNETQSITCDVCKKTYDVEKDWEETQEFVSVNQGCGYGSVFGDGNIMLVDICQHCFKKLLGEYVRFKE